MYSKISSNTHIQPGSECLKQAVFTLINSPKVLRTPVVVLENVHIHKHDTKMLLKPKVNCCWVRMRVVKGSLSISIKNTSSNLGPQVPILSASKRGSKTPSQSQ